MDPSSLLLVLPVPFRETATGELLFERQACNGLERWAENFSHVTVVCPLEPRHRYAGQDVLAHYDFVGNLASSDRMTFVKLPWTYTFLSFGRAMKQTQAVLRAQIERSAYLSFAIGGLAGDWAAVAALQAQTMGRAYSVWTDRVEHRVARGAHLDSRGMRRLLRFVKNRLVVSPLMQRLERRVINGAHLGLFHGHDCFSAYAALNREPHLVHDVHLKPEDQITASQLGIKLAKTLEGRPLRLVYAGRAAAMKGPMQWLQVLSRLKTMQVPFQATWLGDGPLLTAMREEVQQRGLGDLVALPGHNSSRAALMDVLRDADLFVFCHQTPESPRCLIEALMSACPIIGFDSPYPRDLLGERADELLVEMNDIDALANAVRTLDADRTALQQTTAACAAIGSTFSDRSVFKHRSELIKKYLSR